MSTTKDIHDVCLNIIGIPEILTREGNISFYSLLKKSGYFEMHDKITVEAIRQALLEEPDRVIDRVIDWIQYSEDQRCGEWFFLRESGHYEVGFIPSEGDEIPATKYSDPLEACAIFIKHIIEEVRLTD